MFSAHYPRINAGIENTARITPSVRKSTIPHISVSPFARWNKTEL
uniref:Uncharacterized protein n=1 Tax=Anguilla anguilla TaxID=7936 RepID=A0A0E9Q8X3_ANGAN